jgi:hypothetical protein
MKINRFPSPDEVTKNAVNAAIPPTRADLAKSKALLERSDDINKLNTDIVAGVIARVSVIEAALIKSGKLKKDRQNKTTVFFIAKNPPKQIAHMEHKSARYWYRAMSKEDYIGLENGHRLITDGKNDFCGIAPYFDYVTNPKYHGQKKGGTHVVEFTFDCCGQDFVEEIESEISKIKKGKLFTKETPKGEAGGSIGLGPKGLYGGAGGPIFNEKLMTHKFTFRLVAFHCEMPLTTSHPCYYLLQETKK